MKEKANESVKLHRAMQEKLKTALFLDKFKSLPWYLINGVHSIAQTILMSLKTLYELHIKSKN